MAALNELKCRRGDVCLVATKMARQLDIEREITTTDVSCTNCLRCSSLPGAEHQRPQSPNFITLARLRTQSTDDAAAVDQAYGHLRRAVRKASPKGQCLAGAELTKIIAWLGFEYTPDCPCEKHARQMDNKGCKWCRENLDTIVGWLKVEAKKQKLPFSKFIARRIVLVAIRRAEAKVS